MNDFGEIIGNEFLIRSLQNAIGRRKVSHAYIIDGPEGSGKKLLANAFAKTLQCLEGGVSPCGKCISCKTFDDRNHPDVFYIAPVKASIGVDDIRDGIHANIKVKPYKYDRKIYMIDKADMMTAAAQNALLKNIEEPPAYGVFILISRNINNFLPTIRSRCVIFKVKPLTPGQVKSYLEKEGVSIALQNLGAAYAGGSIGQAMKLVQDEGFLECRREIIEALKNLESNSITGAFSAVRQIEKYKDSFGDVLDIIYLWYRDALVYKSTGRDDHFIGADMKLDICTFADRTPLEGLMVAAEAVLEAKRALRYNANFQMAAEVLFLRLAGLNLE